MRTTTACAALAALLTLAPLPASAQPHTADAGAPLLRIEAQAQRDVTDDTAVAVFVVERDGPQPAPLQSAVNGVLQSALAELRRDPALQVRSGAYATQPRYNREGRIEGWRVRAELVAESAEAAAISNATTALSGRMNVASIGFRLSHARRAETESTLTGEAATRFYEKARAVARALGFADVELVEASFGTGGAPMPRVAMAAARGGAAAEAAPVPLEPGTSQVAVTLSGTLRLRR